APKTVWRNPTALTTSPPTIRGVTEWYPDGGSFAAIPPVSRTLPPTRPQKMIGIVVVVVVVVDVVLVVVVVVGAVVVGSVVVVDVAAGVEVVVGADAGVVVGVVAGVEGGVVAADGPPVRSGLTAGATRVAAGCGDVVAVEAAAGAVAGTVEVVVEAVVRLTDPPVLAVVWVGWAPCPAASAATAWWGPDPSDHGWRLATTTIAAMMTTTATAAKTLRRRRLSVDGPREGGQPSTHRSASVAADGPLAGAWRARLADWSTLVRNPVGMATAAPAPRSAPGAAIRFSRAEQVTQPSMWRLTRLRTNGVSFPSQSPSRAANSGQSRRPERATNTAPRERRAVVLARTRTL